MLAEMCRIEESWSGSQSCGLSTATPGERKYCVVRGTGSGDGEISDWKNIWEIKQSELHDYTQQPRVESDGLCVGSSLVEWDDIWGVFTAVSERSAITSVHSWVK